MKKSINNCYINFLGNGNENADLWIIGFEPGGNPFGEKSIDYKKLQQALNGSEKDFIDYLNDEYHEKIEGNTYQYVAKILELFERNECIDRENGTLIFKKNSKAFYSNLFPLSFPTENHISNETILNEYKLYFNDLTSLDRKKIFTKNSIEKRFKNNFEKPLFDKKNIIILKKGYEQYYALLLNVKLDETTKETEYKIKWGRGYSVLPIYKSNGHKIGFLPNGRTSYIELEKFVEKFRAL